MSISFHKVKCLGVAAAFLITSQQATAEITKEDAQRIAEEIATNMISEPLTLSPDQFNYARKLENKYSFEILNSTVSKFANRQMAQAILEVCGKPKLADAVAPVDLEVMLFGEKTLKTTLGAEKDTPLYDDNVEYLLTSKVNAKAEGVLIGIRFATSHFIEAAMKKNSKEAQTVCDNTVARLEDLLP